MLKVSNRNTRKRYVKYPNLRIKSRSGVFIGKTYFRTFYGVYVTEFKQAIVCWENFLFRKVFRRNPWFLWRDINFKLRPPAHIFTISTSLLVTVSVLFVQIFCRHSNIYEKLLFKIHDYIDLAFVLEVCKRRAIDSSFI